MSRIKLVYVAGPYRNADPWQLEQNIRAAEAFAFQIDCVGAYAVCPHTNSRGYFESAQSDPRFWLEATLELMRRCDAAAFLNTWHKSAGASSEFNEAHRLGLRVFSEGDVANGTLRAWLDGVDG